MKKATCFTVFASLFLAGLIVFNSVSYLPVVSGNKSLSVSRSDHGVLKAVSDFSIEEKDGKERLGQKNPNNQSLICTFEESLITCDKVRFFFAYHIPNFLLSAEKRPLYLTYRSILI
jgi:hypothetical protein